MTRIEAYGTPSGERDATLRVVNHDAERRATLDHDVERRATYRWEERETQSGKPSFLEGMPKWIEQAMEALGTRAKEGFVAFRFAKERNFRGELVKK